MILKLKHGRRIALAGPMGRMLAARIGDKAGANPVVVPVPLHRWRLWKRGYNQSALIARALAKAKGWPQVPDALFRARPTPSLGGLNSIERQRALKGAIIVSQRRENDIAGRSIVLIDDVLTSGATSNACVKALKRAGAAHVVIACYARVLHGEAVPESETPETARSRASA